MNFDKVVLAITICCFLNTFLIKMYIKEIYNSLDAIKERFNIEE